MLLLLFLWPSQFVLGGLFFSLTLTFVRKRKQLQLSFADWIYDFIACKIYMFKHNCGMTFPTRESDCFTLQAYFGTSSRRNFGRL